MKTLFLVNPQSQTVKTKGSVLDRVRGDGTVHTEKLTDFEQTDALVKEAAKSGCEWVFIEGGDGTAHGVMTAFMQQRHAFKTFPKFTLLPGGMTNQVCRNIGLRRARAEHIEAMMKAGGGQVHATPLLELDIEGALPQFGFLFSTGGIPTATEYCVTKMYDRGIGGAAAVAATIVRGVAGSPKIRNDMMPPSPIKLHVSGQGEEAEIDTEHLASIVTTLPGLMMGLDPFWGKGNGPLRATFAAADARHLALNALSIWAGRKHKDRSKDGFKSFAADKLDYAYSGPAVLDGEPVLLPKGHVILRATDPVKFIT